MEGGIECFPRDGERERERERATHMQSLKGKAPLTAKGNQGLACKAYALSGPCVRQVGSCTEYMKE